MCRNATTSGKAPLITSKLQALALLNDQIMDVTQAEAEDMTRQLALREGILAGISSGGTLAAALRLAEGLSNAVIATIVCDRGDRYLTTGVFPA